MSFDETLLDDPPRLAHRDEGRLLWALATAGAQVRRAAVRAEESGLDRLGDGTAPRAVLLATDQHTAGVAKVLSTLAVGSAPTVVWAGADLPRWAGAPDALLVATADGRHPRLATLLDQANRRGIPTAVVGPVDSVVAQAAGRAAMAELPSDVHRRALFWSAIVPLLTAAQSLGLLAAEALPLPEVAGALDELAESCRPDSDAFTNPAKALATEFAEATPLIAGAGPLATAAAHLIADDLRLLAGAPAIPICLPDGVAQATGLMAAEGGPADFFRDRGEPESARPRLLVVGDDGSPDDPALLQSEADRQLGEVAARRAAAALHAIAREREIRSSSVDVPPGAPLTRFAVAHGFGSFVATYLALARGLDPSAPRPGEMDH